MEKGNYKELYDFASNDFFVNILEHSSKGFFIAKVLLDEKEKPYDWMYAYCNEGYARLSYMSKEQMIGHTFSEIYPNGNSKWLSLFYQVAYYHESANIEEFSQEIGTYIHLEVSPTAKKGFCLIEDVKKEFYKKTIEREVDERTFLNALCLDYSIVFLCDLKKDTIQTLKSNPFTHNQQAEKDLFKEELSSYTKRMQYFYDHVIFHDSVNDFLDQFLPEGLMKILSKQDSFELRHRAKKNQAGMEYFSIKAVRLYEDEDSFKIIIGIMPIDDQVKRESEDQKRLEKALTDVEDGYENILAISTLYKEIVDINLEKMTYNLVSGPNNHFVRKGKEGELDQLRKLLLEKNILPEEREKVSEFIDFSTLNERLQGKQFIHMEIKSIQNRWYDCKFIVKSKKEDGTITHVLMAVRDIDEQKKLELEQLAISKTLSRNFRNVYLINLNDGTAKVIKFEDEFKDGRLDNFLNQSFPYEGFLNGWIKEAVYEDDQDMLMKSLSCENLRQVFLKQEEYNGNYRMFVDGKIINYQFNISKLDESGNLIAGFQNIEEIIQQHLEEERKQRAKEEMYQNQLSKSLELEKQHSQVIASLSTIYSTIFRAELKTHHYEILNSVELMSSVAFNHGNFDDVKEKILETFMAPSMHAQMRTFLDFDTLAKRLENVNTIAKDFQDPNGRWVQGRFIVKNRDANGVVDEVLYVARDITEEKLYDLKQQEELKRQLQIINALGSEYKALYMVDCQTGMWTVFKKDQVGDRDAVYDQTLQYEKYEDAIDSYIQHFVCEEDCEYLKEHVKLDKILQETPNTGIHSLNYDRILDGVRTHWQLNSAKFTADDGKEYIVIGFRNVHDIVENQIKQENALRDALMLARRASRAKTTFLNNMSHDIRTPMNAIIGFTALAQAHMDNMPLVQDYLGKIHMSGTHLLSLINEILDMSRIESGTVKLEENVIHLPDVLHDFRAIIQGQVNAKQQNLYIDSLDVTHEDVITDKLRLNQILLNIVGNAIKYTGCGGDIAIRVIEKPCAMSGYATYVFSVKDNGMGMSKDFIDRIFDAFSREQTSTVSGIQGTGLGMSITKNIVDMMNGTIEVKSELGKGSEFIVTVDFRVSDVKIENEPILELKHARALVVDDDINTCRSVCKMLRSIEMRPDWSTSGKEAIIRAKEATEIKDEYKAFIIDYMMPDMNGIETVRQIRKVIGDDIPIIILTAYDWGGFEDEAREAGVTAFVSKPIFMSELRAVLSKQKDKIVNVEEESELSHDYSGKHVLLVEDNELNREIATLILKDMKIDVTSANDGIEAINIMNLAKEDDFDLIMMDIQMPRMDGYTATREIRTFKNNKKANIPIVAMTANAFDEDRKKSFEAGMNGHIAKPIDSSAIGKLLDQIWYKDKNREA